MKVFITYEQELPEGTTQEQAEQWLDFEINGGEVEKGNPLIDSRLNIDTVDACNLVETEIE